MTQALLLALLAAGRLEGTIGYSGRAVRAPKIVRTDPGCKQALTDPTVTLSKSGKALVNVIVRVVSTTASEPPAEPLVITQRDCMYEPRISAAVKGQRVLVKNADGTLHNVHGYTGLDGGKTLFNVVQPAGAADLERDPKTAGLIRLECDVHLWMRAYVMFAPNALFAVSDAEGRWAIDVPAGKYTLEAWHEKLGTQTIEVTVEDGKTVKPELTFR